MNIATGIGTGGYTLSASRSINNYLGARESFYVAGELSETETVDNNVYSIDFTPKANGLILDVTPFKGHFYVAAGLVNQNIEFTFNGKADQAYNLNGNSYTLNEDLKSISTTVGFDKSSAPYLGFGWSNRYSKYSGFTYSIDIGFAQWACQKPMCL